MNRNFDFNPYTFKIEKIFMSQCSLKKNKVSNLNLNSKRRSDI